MTKNSKSLADINSDPLSQKSDDLVDSFNSISNFDFVSLIDLPDWKSMLFGIVKSEKMDPWDIDISILADNYLSKIRAMESSNLSVPANAILASAILLKTKAKTLKFSSLEEPEEDELSLEQKQAFVDELPSLSISNPTRERRVSLDELVSSIEEILSEKSVVPSVKRDFIVPEPKFLLNLDAVSIEEKLDSVYSEVLKLAELDSNKVVLFSKLIKNSSPSKIVDYFIPLLFLASKNKLSLFQESFFDEIFIKVLPDDLSDVSLSNTDSSEDSSSDFSSSELSDLVNEKNQNN